MYQRLHSNSVVLATLGDVPHPRVTRVLQLGLHDLEVANLDTTGCEEWNFKVDRNGLFAVCKPTDIVVSSG